MGIYSLRAEYLHNLFEFFLQGRSVSSWLFIYSMIYLYQYELIEFLFPTLGFSLILIYSIAQIFLALALGSSFSSVLYFFLFWYYLCVCACVYSSFLHFFFTARCSRLIFEIILVPGSAIPPRNSGFYLENIIRN